jgi:hypothetical protein
MHMKHTLHAKPLLIAIQGTPKMAALIELNKESSARFKSIEPLIPGTLRFLIQPGPIEGSTWCLILDNSAVASKVRQILPAIISHLRCKGRDIDSVRLKVTTRKSVSKS